MVAPKRFFTPSMRRRGSCVSGEIGGVTFATKGGPLDEWLSKTHSPQRHGGTEVSNLLAEFSVSPCLCGELFRTGTTTMGRSPTLLLLWPTPSTLSEYQANRHCRA